MIIRSIGRDEYEKFLRVSSLAFVWNLDLSTEPEMPENINLLCAFDDDDRTIMSQLEYRAVNFSFCGNYLPAIAVGGVATAPEYRRRGAVRALFAELENRAESEGFAAGFLYPFSPDYYRRFSYERVNRSVELSVPFTLFDKFERNSDTVLYNGDPGDRAKLYALYTEFTRKHNILFERLDDTYFPTDPHGSGNWLYMHRSADGGYDAYAKMRLDRANSVVNVEELAYLGREPLCAMLGFLRCFDSQAGKVIFRGLPEGGVLPEIFTEYNKCQMSVSNGASARIYDVERVLRANAYPQEGGRFRLRCHDNIEKNDAVFTVEYGGGGCEVTRGEGEYDLALSAAMTARFLLSGEGLSASMCAYLDGVELRNDAADFFRAFPRRSVCLWDGF